MTTTAIPMDRQSPWRDELRATLSLAWPLILTNLSMSLIGATDVVMVGWLGPTELAAASLGFNLCMTAAIFCMGLVTATAPMMASERGAKAHSVRDIRRTFRQGLWVAVAIMIPIWLVLWQTESVLLALGQQADLASKAQSYVRAYMWSILPFLWLIIARNFLSALERPMWSLVIGIMGVIANAAFNYVLIFGKLGVPALGIIGAGIGSILANMFMFMGMVAVITFHPKFRRYHLFGRWWRSDWPRFRALWKLGLPIGITMGLEGGVFGVAVMLMGLIDTASVAAHAIALQVASVTFMVPMGLAQAATVRVGIGYGRRDQQLIRRAGWTSFVMGTGFMAAHGYPDVDFARIAYFAVHRQGCCDQCRGCATGRKLPCHRGIVPDCGRGTSCWCWHAARIARHPRAHAVRGLWLLGSRHWRRRLAGI